MGIFRPCSGYEGRKQFQNRIRLFTATFFSIFFYYQLSSGAVPNPQTALGIAFLHKGGEEERHARVFPRLVTAVYINVIPIDCWKNTGEGHLLLPHPEQRGRGPEAELGPFSGQVRREILQGHPCLGGRGVLSTR